MRITKLILEGYIRLMYAGINHFEYTITSPYQLILGTNGSGKSSVLAELSPLPASRQFFIVGGYKHIEIEHNGSYYSLTSDFKSGNKHTFICDNQLLNDGGTATLQKELVAQHFNYTPDLHALLTGDLKFTEMTTLQRRDWISRACTTDVTYALGLFQRLKSAARDALGARKHAETRLAVEYKGLYTEEELNELQARIEAITGRITELMYQTDTQIPPVSDAQRQYRELSTELQTLASDQLLRLDTRTLRGTVSVESLQELKTKISSELEYTTTSLSERRKEFIELEDTIAQLTQIAGGTGNGLSEELVHLREKLKEYYSASLSFDFGEGDFVHMSRLAGEVDDVLTDRLLALPPNVNKRFNRVVMEQTSTLLEELVASRNVKSTELARLHARRETIQNAEKTTCPSCGYIWVPGVSEHELKVVNDKIELLEMQLNQVNTEYTKNSEFMEELIEWRRLFSDFHSILKINPALSPLWKEFIKGDLIYNDPNACVHLFYRWKDQLKTLSDRTELEHRIEEIEVVIKRASELAKGDSTQVLTSRAKNIENEIQRLTQREIELRAEREQISKQLQIGQSAETTCANVVKTVDLLSNAMIQWMKALQNEQLSQAISSKQSELAQLSFQLSEKRSARDIVRSLELTRVELLDKEADYQILIDNLSPTSGLIAEQLAGCITSLIDQINEYIGMVWTYDLKLLPCGLESGDLDYKFPVEIKGYPKPISDIDKGSGGQQDIFNFTFLLVVMSFMDLRDYPLYPDELGATFDPEHRQRIVNFLKQLVESKRTSQIFYISHNPEAYDTLTNAEICVMDDTNIGEIPGANQHVIIS